MTVPWPSYTGEVVTCRYFFILCGDTLNPNREIGLILFLELFGHQPQFLFQYQYCVFIFLFYDIASYYFYMELVIWRFKIA